MVFLSLFFCFMFGLSEQAFAQMTEQEIQTEIADNIAGEYIDCGVYFNIAFEGINKAGNATLAKQYSNLVDQCFAAAYALIKSNRTEEMANKVSLSLVSMTNKSMRDEIDNNFSNLSVLSNQYMDRCISIIQDPTDMMTSWSQKIRSKY